MNLGKKEFQFPTAESAQAYLATLKTTLRPVDGETTTFVIVDDRSLEEAKAERRVVVGAAAKSAYDPFTPDETFQARMDAAVAAIDAAATNAEADAVTF